jgi:hypothetical protein
MGVIKAYRIHFQTWVNLKVQICLWLPFRCVRLSAKATA